MPQYPLGDVVVIFDLDGTLIDSAPDLTAALNHVLAGQGLPEADAAAVRGLVGHGARALLVGGYRLAGQTFPQGPEGERLVTQFIDFYRANIAVRTRLFADAEDCIDKLVADGAVVAVCTNKLEALAFPVLEALGVRSRFDPIICRDSLPEYKPSPQPLLEILRRTGRAQGIMVGDTMTDLGAARAAGMPAFFATFGYGELDGDLQKNEQRFDGFEALPQEILNLLG